MFDFERELEKWRREMAAPGLAPEVLLELEEHLREDVDRQVHAGIPAPDALKAALQSAGRTADFHIYPDTGHWFFEPDRTDAFNQAAASLAWDRTLAFLKASSSV